MLAKSRDLKIQQLLKKITDSRLIIAVLAVICVLLALNNLLIRGTEKIIIKPDPKSTSSYWVQDNAVSHELLEDLTDNILRLALNVVPDVAHARIERVLRFVHPGKHGVMKAKLVDDADYIKKNEISQIFIPKTYIVENKGKSVLVKGTLTHWIGEEKISKEIIGYRVKYQIDGGMPLVTKIEEVDVK